MTYPLLLPDMGDVRLRVIPIGLASREPGKRLRRTAERITVRKQGTAERTVLPEKFGYCQQVKQD
jgi:hypothetical protein